MRSGSSVADIANIAARQYNNRQHRAAEMRRAGKISEEAATRHLRPWLAIACLCGAQLPELDDGIASHRNLQLIYGEKPPTVTEKQARRLLADEISPRRDWVPVLAAARDAALDAIGGDADQENARALIALVRRLQFAADGRDPIPPYIPREAAAQSEKRAA